MAFECRWALEPPLIRVISLLWQDAGLGYVQHVHNLSVVNVQHGEGHDTNRVYLLTSKLRS